jgi:glycerol-3-phosphate acyltransferase PlsY
MLLPLLIAAVVGYVLGALPFGYLVARAKGINIFEHGSKNPGATNVLRVLSAKFGAPGKRLGILVFVLDALKGAVAAGWPIFYYAANPIPNFVNFTDEGVWIPGVTREPLDSGYMAWLAVTGLIAALIGHSFSCFTKFKGGKGVATASGGLLVLMPLPLLAGLGVWLVTFYTTRFVSLASILSACALPLAAWLFNAPPLLVGLSGAIAIFVAIRHRTNIARLLAGTESKFSKKSAPTSTNPPSS